MKLAIPIPTVRACGLRTHVRELLRIKRTYKIGRVEKYLRGEMKLVDVDSYDRAAFKIYLATGRMFS